MKIVTSNIGRKIFQVISKNKKKIGIFGALLFLDMTLLSVNSQASSHTSAGEPLLQESLHKEKLLSACPKNTVKTSSRRASQPQGEKASKVVKAPSYQVRNVKKPGVTTSFPKSTQGPREQKVLQEGGQTLSPLRREMGSSKKPSQEASEEQKKKKSSGKTSKIMLVKQ